MLSKFLKDFVVFYLVYSLDKLEGRIRDRQLSIHTCQTKIQGYFSLTKLLQDWYCGAHFSGKVNNRSRGNWQA